MEGSVTAYSEHGCHVFCVVRVNVGCCMTYE